MVNTISQLSSQVACLQGLVAWLKRLRPTYLYDVANLRRANLSHPETSTKFPLGQVVATPGALAAFEECGEEPTPYLQCHCGGEWGDVNQQDRLENETSLQHGFRLLSAYTLRTGVKIWIITEADRDGENRGTPTFAET